MSAARVGDAAQGPAPLSWRAGFAVTLALAMAAGAFPGYAFGILGPFLVDEFTLSRSQLGLLTTGLFLVGGSLSLPAGTLVDRHGGRRVMLGAFAVLGAAMATAAAAPSFPLLVVAAALAGVALAAGNPTTNKLVAVHVPAGRRGITMGFKQAGVQVGAFLTGALLAPAAAAWGWRLALAASVAVPVAGVVATLRIVPDDRGARSAPAGVGPIPARAGAAAAAGRRAAPLPAAVRWLAAYAFLMGAGVAAVNAYLPLYGVERLGLSVRVAGAAAALIGAVGIASRVVWGWLSERRSGFVAPLLVMAAGAVAALALVVAAQVAGAWLLWPAALVLGATAVTWNAVGMLAVLDEVEAADAGRASGYVLFGFYGGFVPSPILFGAVVDATGDYRVAWTAVAGVFTAAALLMAWWGRASRRSGSATRD